MNCPRCDAPAKTETLREFGGVCEYCLLDFAAEKDAPAFPGLKILRTLGEGGMGVVYEAEQTALGRKVALKVLSPALASDPSFVERFTREAKALAQLSHPNIVGIHEFGVHDKVPYLVMEYVEGTSLRKLLKKLDGARALEIVPQICDALAYAHGRGIVHRDIKPENILLDRQGRVKIADFGLAKLAEPDQTRITRTNAVMGTPHYMAPEQMENPGAVDHRADLFSLGVVFYEMLTGELPLGRFKAPSERSGADRRLDPVVLKSLERAPEDRWQSADAMKDRVTRLEPAGPPPTNWWSWASLAALPGALITVVVAARLAPGASWAAIFPFAAIPAVAAAIFAVLGIVKAPRVDGRRHGIAPALITVGLLALTAVLLLALTLRESRVKSDASTLTWVTVGLMATAGGWFFRRRRSSIQTAWFLFGISFGLAILQMELNSAALALAAVVAVAVANVLAIMGLVLLRGRSAPGEKMAGWALPALTVLAVLGFFPSAGAESPPSPAAPRAPLSMTNVADFKVVDHWPKDVDLPRGQRFGTEAELHEAQKASGLRIAHAGHVRSFRVAVLVPSRVILVGLEFEDAARLREWETWTGLPGGDWRVSRFRADRTVLQICAPRSEAQTADALWAVLKVSLSGS